MSTVIIWASLAHWICLFPPFINLLHLLISVWTHGYWLCTWGYNPILLYLFCYSKCLSFGCFELCQLTPLPFISSLRWWEFFFEHFPTFCHYKMLIMYITCPSPRVIPFSIEPFFLLMDDDIRNITFFQLNILIFISCHYIYLYSTMIFFTFKINFIEV